MMIEICLYCGVSSVTYLQIHRIFDLRVTAYVPPCLPVCLLVRQGVSAHLHDKALTWCCATAFCHLAVEKVTKQAATRKKR